MIADNRSRPWSSAPITKLWPVNMLGVIGGVKPFIRFSEAGSNGFVGAISGARIAMMNRNSTTAAASMASGARVKSNTKSLARMR